MVKKVLGERLELTYQEYGDLSFEIANGGYAKAVARHLRALREFVSIVATQRPDMYERRAPEVWRRCVMREVAILMALPKQRAWMKSKDIWFPEYE